MAPSGPPEPPAAAAAAALPEPLQQALTAWPSPELEAQLAGADVGSLAAGLQQQELAWEAALFAQMLYRHKNQHRNTLSFRRLLEVRRGLRLLLGLRLPELMRAFAGLFRLRHLSQQESTVASGEAGVLLLRRLLAACRLAEAAAAAIRKAASLTSAHLARLHFVRMHMLFLAMLARIQVLVCGLLLRCVRCYNELAGLVGLLPFLGASQQQAGAELPEMLRCDWRGGGPAVALLPFPPGEGLAQRSAQHGLRFQPPAPPASLQERAVAEAEAAIQAVVPQGRREAAAGRGAGRAGRQQRPKPAKGTLRAAGADGRPLSVQALAPQRLERQTVWLPPVGSAGPTAAVHEPASAGPPPQAGDAQPAAPQLQPPEVQPARLPVEANPLQLPAPAAAQPVERPAGAGAPQPAVQAAQQLAAQPAQPAAAVQRSGRGFASGPLLGVGKRPGLKALGGRFGSVAIASASLPAAAGSRPPPVAGAAAAQGWAAAAPPQPLVRPATDTGAAPLGAAGSGGAAAAAGPRPSAALVPTGSGPAAAAASLGGAPDGAAAEQPEDAGSGAGKRAAGPPLLLPPAGKKRKGKGKGKAAQAQPAEAAPGKQPSWLDLNPW